jgi:isocitrate dehydrogenase
MTSKSSKSNNSLEGYVVKILEDINFYEPEIVMKQGLGKIRNQSEIAKSIETSKSNLTFLRALKFAVEKKWLMIISTKKDFSKIFEPNSRYRKNYSAPAYVLTQNGLAFVKSVSYITNTPDLVEMLKIIISKEASDENYQQIESLFKDYENPFIEFKKLKIFDVG